MLHEVSFKSVNKRDEVQGWVYVPADEPMGIVQLVHGFGEHSRRYFHMIVRLMEAGYIVAADDHVGHGKTAVVNNKWGDWGEGGCHTMMEDEHTLTALVKEMYPGLPYFMFGHSMGSFIARDYVSKYGSELDGVVFCGTSGVFPGAREIAEKMKSEVIDTGKGSEPDTHYGNDLLGWMCERCTEEIRYGNEWICDSPYVQKDHANDPFDAFTKAVTNQSIYDFIQMILVIEGREWAEKVPKKLPIYNIAGDQDPVGQYGGGVYEVSNWLIETGHQVKTKLYAGYRHEIHNYKAIKEEVSDGIIQFLCECRK